MAMKQVAKEYKKLVDEIAKILKGEAEAVTSGNFGEDKTAQFEVKTLTHEDIRKALFLRQSIEADYQKLYDKGELTYADMAMLSSQSDIMSALERAYRARTRSRLGVLVSGVSRAHGQSQDNGYIKHVLAAYPIVDRSST
jgi:hypothetical protein